MERIDLEDLEATLAKATPGPWSVEMDGPTDDDSPCDVIVPEINRILHSTEWADPDDFWQDVANTESIVAAHNALPALIAELRELRAEVERLREDAGKLRVLLATSNANCAFCGLPAAEMAKCASGFPGCSRADDMILCVHPTRQDLLDEVERLREHQERARWCEEMRADVRWNPVRKLWFPQWWKDGVLNQVSHADRNAAIDAARGVKWCT